MSATHEAPAVRVLLVREWEQQLSSSGCCGRIEGEFLEPATVGEPLGHEPEDRTRPFAERRREMERAGHLYRALRERYDEDVEVQIVDPRNLPALLPMVVADARRYGRSVGETLRTLLRLSVSAVVVNGHVVARSRWPDEDEVFSAVDRERT